MTTAQKDKVARRKLSLLELAKDLGNVSKACQVMGYSRQQFYEIRRNFQVYGAEGLIDRLPGPKGPHPNRVGEEVEKAILDHCLACPTHGAQRVADELMLKGIVRWQGEMRSLEERGATGSGMGIEFTEVEPQVRASLEAKLETLPNA